METPWGTGTTHPFVVFEGSCETHGLDEFSEGPHLFFRGLGCLFHVQELEGGVRGM